MIAEFSLVAVPGALRARGRSIVDFRRFFEVGLGGLFSDEDKTRTQPQNPTLTQSPKRTGEIGSRDFGVEFYTVHHARTLAIS